MSCDPRKCGFREIAILVVHAEIPQTLHANDRFIRLQPVEGFIEEPRVASSDFESEEEKCFGVGGPAVMAISRGEDAELRPLVPGEADELASNALSKRRGIDRPPPNARAPR